MYPIKIKSQTADCTDSHAAGNRGFAAAIPQNPPKGSRSLRSKIRLIRGRNKLAELK